MSNYFASIVKLIFINYYIYETIAATGTI